MKFSIIICTYNTAKRLPKTLDSILAQTFGDYEVVIIDGASTDGTQEVIKDYQEKFDGRLVFISEPDAGLYNAMNKGVKMAKGEFLEIIGAGDWLESNALEEASKCIAKYSKADAVYGKTRVWDKDQKTNHLVQTTVELLPTQPMQHPSMFYKKALHDKFGLYDESYKITADYAFCLKAFYVGKAVAQSFDAVIDNFVMDGISSKNEWKCLQENRRARLKVGIKPKGIMAEFFSYIKNKIKNG